VRAAIAKTPEASDYTSIQRRIRTLQDASESSADGTVGPWAKEKLKCLGK